MRRIVPYIHLLPDWPQLASDQEKLALSLASLRHRQGRLLGRMEALGFTLQNEATLNTLTLDVLKSSEIEGERLNPDQVRSSIARRLGMDIAGLVSSDRHVDGVVDMMLDATQKHREPLSRNRLFGWHSALFPSGRSGLYKIKVGAWRDDDIQVVSGAMGKERVHFQAPDASRLESEMEKFITWVNSHAPLDPVLKAGIAHFWFVTIHPFADGNGRIARALADMLLARADGTAQRFYSMSAQIQRERRDYYDSLEEAQKGTLDITRWLEWFLACLDRALTNTETLLGQVISKAQFWERANSHVLSERQKRVLNKFLDGFEGKLTSSKWAKMAKCSQDTALRDIQDLIEKGLLIKEDSGGRSTSYTISQ